MTEENDKPEDGDDADSSDWLSKQFGSGTGTGDEPAKPKPALPDPPLNNPLATPPASPPAASPPATFNWGLTPATSATPPDPPVAPPPATPPPAAVPPVAATPPTTPPLAAPPPAIGPPEPQPFPRIETEPRPALPQSPPQALQPPPATPPAVGPPEPPATVAAPVVSPATELLSSGDAPAIRAEPEPTAPEPAASEPTESDPIEAASTIDALFGEQQFKEYEDAPLLGGLPFTAPPFTAPPFTAPSFTAQQDPDAAAPAAPPKPPHAPLDKNQKILLWIAGGAVAVLALLLLFLLGTKIPELLGPAPVVAVSKSPSATPSVTPTSTTPAAGPVAPGKHKWNELLGGECLDPFTSPWAETFTVVDCASPHPAQMVFRGTFPTAAAYPGAAALQAQINLLCTATGVIDLSTAGAYNDIQFQAAYPVTEKEWTSGYHDYFCFVNRSSGGPITGSVAGAHPAG